MGTISKNFSYSEFEHSDTAQELGICNVITTYAVRDSIKSLVDSVLQPLRDAWGNALKINSGYRCDELNAAVGGTKTSQHRTGEAADIAAPDPLALARLAESLNLPYDQMILYPTFVHFSHKFEGEQRRQVLYNSSYQGDKI